MRDINNTEFILEWGIKRDEIITSKLLMVEDQDNYPIEVWSFRGDTKDYSVYTVKMLHGKLETDMPARIWKLVELPSNMILQMALNAYSHGIATGISDGQNLERKNVLHSK